MAPYDEEKTRVEMMSYDCQSRSLGFGGSSSSPENGSSVGPFRNPLLQMTCDEVIIDVDHFVEANKLAEYRDVMHKGALLARARSLSEDYQRLGVLDKNDLDNLRIDAENSWKAHPLKLYLLCALCAGCAIVQGMDQTVINGAQVRTWMKEEDPNFLRSRTVAWADGNEGWGERTALDRSFTLPNSESRIGFSRG